MVKFSFLRLAASITAASALAFSSLAQANIIDVTVSGPGADQSHEQAFWDQLSSRQTEGFEGDVDGLNANNQGLTIGTSVGEFSTIANDPTEYGTSCEQESFVCGKGLGIVEGDLFGRFPMPDTDDNNRYLDTLDHQEMNFEPTEGTNAIGFFLTDPNDQNGILDITVAGEDGTDTSFSETIENILDTDGNIKTGSVYYLSFFASSGSIANLSLNMNNTTDGIGVDNVTVGTVAVPEPGTLALLGLGLTGLVLARRRKKL